MKNSLSLEIYSRLEEKVGKEEAKAIAEAIEAYIDEKIREKRSKFKAELKEELKNELATRYDIELIKKEIELVRKDLKTWFIVLILLIIFFNQNALEFFAKILANAIEVPNVKFAPNFSLFFPALSIKKLSKSFDLSKSLSLISFKKLSKFSLIFS